MSRYYTSEKILLPMAGRKLAVYLFRPTKNRKPPILELWKTVTPP